MRHWNLKAAPEGDRTGPRVLFSTAEARAVVIELEPGQEMGKHHVRERALVQVVEGGVEVTTEDQTIAADKGMLILFEPAEHHVVRAREQTQLLLILAPWPAPDHYLSDEADKDPHKLPIHATGREGSTE